MRSNVEVPMPAQSIAARLIACILLAAAACVSFPSCAQTVRHAPPHWAGAGRLHGFPFDPRAAFAGALIGGVIAALSARPYIDAPQAPLHDAQLPQRDPYDSSGRSASRAGSIADGWQQFGESQRDTSKSTSQFVEGWQRFFEPSH
jgi:hypothetical protein